MAKVLIPIENAVAIRRPKGSQVTLVNQTAVDVYIDFNRQRLEASAVGAVPDGTKIAANTGQVQVDSFPGVIYARSAVATSLEVQP